MKWQRHDVHLQSNVPSYQFHTVITYDDDNDRIILTGGDYNLVTNWNDMKSSVSSSTSTNNKSISGNRSDIPTTDTLLLHSLPSINANTTICCVTYNIIR
jgi:hypothetical protein